MVAPIGWPAALADAMAEAIPAPAPGMLAKSVVEAFFMLVAEAFSELPLLVGWGLDGIC
jgi:hypothetical protein